MLTPPSEKQPVLFDTAISVLRAQAETLAAIAADYSEPSEVQSDFSKSLNILHDSVLAGGKIILTAIGKSLKIAEKLTATLNSLGISSMTLHPTDALHGDLGVVNSADVMVMITVSGNTPELFELKSHLPPDLKWLCLTCQRQSPLALASFGVLSAPIPKEYREVTVYGLAAPTVSTTACLAVGDSMCITLNEMLVSDAKQRQVRFGKWHPGGAIGKSYRQDAQFYALGDLTVLGRPLHECQELELWRASSFSPYILSQTKIYSSGELTEWLRNGRFTPLVGIDLDGLPRLPRHEASTHDSLCVVINDNQEAIGLCFP